MSSPRNWLLSALSPTEYTRLTARMTRLTIGHKERLYRAGSAMDHVYFPSSGVLSAVLIMNDGETAEVAVIGREGMTGAATCIGAVASKEEVYCQVHPVECLKWLTSEFTAEVSRNDPFRVIVHAYLREMLSISMQQTACNCLHLVDERCARWLLMCHDRVGTDEFPLTQEFLSTMLGVRRATVTATARSLQGAGLITYKRGRVKIIDRPGLEEAACECYQALRLIAESPPS